MEFRKKKFKTYSDMINIDDSSLGLPYEVQRKEGNSCGVIWGHNTEELQLGRFVQNTSTEEEIMFSTNALAYELLGVSDSLQNKQEKQV
jgi:hypothetical protein